MNVLISTIGSRGEVQPVLALALELRALGHDVRVCVPSNFKDWVESFGLRAHSIGFDTKRPAGAGDPSKPFKPTAEQKRQLVALTVRNQIQVLSEAAPGCDLIIGAGGLQIATRSVAESLAIPYVSVAYCPATLPAPDYPPAKIGPHHPKWRPPGHRISASPSRERRRFRLLWKKDERIFNETFRDLLNHERAQLGLAPIKSVQPHVFTDRPWLCADPTLAPASPRSRTPIVQTGAWFLSEQSPLPGDLESFLANGEPPVYFGFGSMRGSEQTGRLLIEAARAVGLRAILSRGWDNLVLADSGADCISIGDVNHETLFARVAAVVHHGGAGTTSTAARAGKPQVIAPHMFDQFYFAQRVQKLGVGVACPPREHLSVNAMAYALRQCLQPTMKARAQSLGRRIVRDGAKIAAQQLTHEFETRRA